MVFQVDLQGLLEKLYRKYRNKKPSNKGTNLKKIFEDYEINKYQTIYDKLLSMLEDEECYNETTWQLEIVDILLLLYPKYIAVFREVPVNADDLTTKSLDYLFVDANGHVDVVEIKQPFDHAIMTKGKYRDNYIPLRELSRFYIRTQFFGLHHAQVGAYQQFGDQYHD